MKILNSESKTSRVHLQGRNKCDLFVRSTKFVNKGGLGGTSP